MSPANGGSGNGCRIPTTENGDQHEMAARGVGYVGSGAEIRNGLQSPTDKAGADMAWLRRGWARYGPARFGMACLNHKDGGMNV